MEEIVRLTNILNESANKYYNGQIPTLSDVEYDNLLVKLEQLEKEKGIQLDNSPTKNVGYKVLDSIPKKILPRKMLSLDKVKNDIDALMKWIDNKECVMSLKLDGLSCMLEYQDGILVGCYTRGNGVEGSDVTEMVKSLPSVPKRIDGKGRILVIGEVIIRESNFNRVNEERVKNGESIFANPRNLASGTLLSLDTSLGRKRGLEFVAFDYYGHLDSNKYQKNKNIALDYIGFNVVPYIISVKYLSIDLVQHNMDILLEDARALGYPIDGIVITYDDLEYKESLGYTEKFPLGSIAFKFSDDFEETILRDIEWSMSRNGILTPVAIFDTVELDGTEVSRASIHNVSMLRTLELGIGDTVKVVKANQIIPQIIDNETKSNNYKLPKECPYCGKGLMLKGENSLELACINFNCTEQQILKINHFLSKDALNAKGVSESIIKKLMSFREIENLYDLLELPKKREELIKKNLPTLGRKSINNICDAIEKSKNTTLERFIIGLGLEQVGRKVSKDLVKKYGTIDNLINNISIEELKSIQGINEIASIIYEGFMGNKEHIEKLLQYVNIESVNTVPQGTKLEGKIFVFTGKTIEFKNRKEIDSFISEQGGLLASSVSSKTNYLICNQVETSSKYKKALELGIDIITEKDLLEFVK